LRAKWRYREGVKDYFKEGLEGDFWYFLRRSWMASSSNLNIDTSLSTLKCFSCFRRLLSILVANIFLLAMEYFYQKKMMVAKEIV
jgi:hypothetical protein